MCVLSYPKHVYVWNLNRWVSRWSNSHDRAGQCVMSLCPGDISPRVQHGNSSIDVHRFPIDVYVWDDSLLIPIVFHLCLFHIFYCYYVLSLCRISL